MESIGTRSVRTIPVRNDRCSACIWKQILHFSHDERKQGKLVPHGRRSSRSFMCIHVSRVKCRTNFVEELSWLGFFISPCKIVRAIVTTESHEKAEDIFFKCIASERESCLRREYDDDDRRRGSPVLHPRYGVASMEEVHYSYLPPFLLSPFRSILVLASMTTTHCSLDNSLP